jgi:hypothetical protein
MRHYTVKTFNFSSRFFLRCTQKGTSSFWHFNSVTLGNRDCWLLEWLCGAELLSSLSSTVIIVALLVITLITLGIGQVMDLISKAELLR